MARIISFSSHSKKDGQPRNVNFFRKIWEWFNSRDRFVKFAIVTVILITIATPFIVKNLLDLRQRAAPVSFPNDPIPFNFVFDDMSTGNIEDIISTNDAVYVVGGFSYVGPFTGDFAKVNSTTAEVITTTPTVYGGIGDSESDGNGGWYIGGHFYKINSSTEVEGLAHILADGTVDPSFDFDGVDGIRNITFSQDRQTMYILGSIPNREEIAAIDMATNTITSFSVDLTGHPGLTGDPTAGQISSIGFNADESIMYIGGRFSEINGVARNDIAAINMSDGSVVPTFNPNPSPIGWDEGGVYFIISPDKSFLYVVGGFTSIGGMTIDKLAKIRTSDGTAVTNFDPNPTNPNPGNFSCCGLAITSDGSTLYVGGAFTQISGENRNNLAALNTSDGSATSFDPNVTNINASFGLPVKASGLVLSPDESILYVSGRFDHIGGATRYNTAAVETATGNATPWHPKTTRGGGIAFNPTNSSELLVYSAESIGPNVQQRNGLVKIGCDGTIDPTFNPNANNWVNEVVLSPDGNILYAGGNFTNIGGQTRNGLAALDIITGSASSNFNPNVTGHPFASSNNISSITALALSSDGDKLYFGGWFLNVGGQPRNYMAAVNTSDGSLIPEFNPNPDTGTNRLLLTSDDSIIYAAGLFDSIGGQSRAGVAALNTADGTATSFIADASPAVVRGLALTQDESILYIGGDFLSMSGQSRSMLASVRATDSAVLPFNPEMDPGDLVRSIVLSQDDQTLYASGHFDSLGGQPRRGLGAVNALDGSLDPWNPNTQRDHEFEATTSENHSEAINLSPDESRIFFSGSWRGLQIFTNDSGLVCSASVPSETPTPTSSPTPTPSPIPGQSPTPTSTPTPTQPATGGGGPSPTPTTSIIIPIAPPKTGM